MEAQNIFPIEFELFSKEWCKAMINHLTKFNELMEKSKRHPVGLSDNKRQIERLQEFVDGKILMTPELTRLIAEWKQYGSIIIAFGYDDTVHPWRLNDVKYCDKVIKLIIDCKLAGAYTVCNTPCHQDRFPEIRQYLLNKGLKIDTINENPIELPYGNNARPYANIILDNRAGLSEAMKLLENALALFNSYKSSQRTNFDV